MKTALLHYWLTNLRGGEKVLAEIGSLFPGADIFTHACRREMTDRFFPGHRITESMIAALPGARRNCQKYLPLMPHALKKFDFSGYDLIISSESGPAKGIRKPSSAVHVCYCHTPMRYLWDMYDDYYDVYPESYRIVGQMTNKVYSLGQKVTVMVHDASYYDGTIDFILC